MVDVGRKEISRRTASASCVVIMSESCRQQVVDQAAVKGDVLGVSRVAGIMAAKRTSDLIPLCHPLGLDSVTIDFSMDQPDRIQIHSRVQTTDRTGVEMEALTGASVAALTIYDMCKSIDRSMVITNLQLDEKTGGASGDYVKSNLVEGSQNDG